VEGGDPFEYLLGVLDISGTVGPEFLRGIPRLVWRLVHLPGFIVQAKPDGRSEDPAPARSGWRPQPMHNSVAIFLTQGFSNLPKYRKLEATFPLPLARICTPLQLVGQGLADAHH